MINKSNLVDFGNRDLLYRKEDLQTLVPVCYSCGQYFQDGVERIVSNLCMSCVLEENPEYEVAYIEEVRDNPYRKKDIFFLHKTNQTIHQLQGSNESGYTHFYENKRRTLIYHGFTLPAVVGEEKLENFTVSYIGNPEKLKIIIALYYRFDYSDRTTKYYRFFLLKNGGYKICSRRKEYTKKLFDRALKEVHEENRYYKPEWNSNVVLEKALTYLNL